jgi:putative peptidoglycan lipid II flippase
MVAAGILFSRVLGFVRERVFAYYFGNAPAADAFRAALKIPNLVRNFLGEGTLSASFIPVYTRAVERGDEAGARALAGAVLGLLSAATAASALLGIWLAPVITDFVAFGFPPETRALTIQLVRVLFPMTGLMVVSGWCLGILNSHGRFFLAYAAPGVWNIAGIAALWLGASWRPGAGPAYLAMALAWGTLIGSLLQVGVQLPGCARLLRGLPFSLATQTPGLSAVLQAWVPVLLGAGVAQVASIIDTQLGSLAGPGSVAALGYAQLLQNLPISLFGVSVAAASLPDLSREADRETGRQLLRDRLGAGFSRIFFFVCPIGLAYVVLGRCLVAALFETGRFGAVETDVVSGVLAAYGVGLLGFATVKLFASGYYALRDTRTPVVVAASSLAVGTGLSLIFMYRSSFGVAGIAFGSSLAAFLNTVLHLRGLDRRLGEAILGRDELRSAGRVIVASALAALLGAGLLAVARGWHPIPLAAVACSGFGLGYLFVAALLGHEEARRLLRRRR